MGTKVLAIIIAAMVVFATLGIICILNSGNDTTGKILIDGDDELVAYVESHGLDGSGVPDDPFMLKDMTISISSNETALSISNTSLSVIIENCLVKGEYAPKGTETGSIGILLRNVIDTCIQDINVTECRYGIVIEKCENITIAGSYLASYSDGSWQGSDLWAFIASDSEYLTLDHSMVRGILCLDRCENGLIANNDFSGTDGLVLRSSSNISVHDNKIGARYTSLMIADSFDVHCANNR
ncbi:MAG TPA: NosD domain-containing protein [Methanomassiliicoccales archaeon]|nr:NosD domain-containing protein [Methanomassiliicoccales archaeon]